MQSGSAQLGGAGWFAGVCAPVWLPGCGVEPAARGPLVGPVDCGLRRGGCDGRLWRDRTPPYWVYLERQNDRYGGLEAQRIREPDVVELGSSVAQETKSGRRATGAVAAGETKVEDGVRRYGAARIGDVSPVRGEDRVAEAVRRVYRADVVTTGTLADVLG